MNRALTAGLVATGLLMASSLRAETLDATWLIDSGAGPEVVATWQQDSNPTPFGAESGILTIVLVSDYSGLGGPLSFSYLTYGNASSPVDAFLVTTTPFAATGGQIYTGDEFAPVFAPGSFSGTGSGPGITGDDSTIIFTVAVPEAPTWVMGLLGFGGAGLFYARRRRAGAATEIAPATA